MSTNKPASNKPKPKPKDKRMAAKRETQERRKLMICKTYELKIDKSHLPERCKKHLQKLFLEAKWFYNDSLSSFKNKQPVNTTKTNVMVKTPTSPNGEKRPLECLSSQMKQSFGKNILDSTKSLKVLDSHKRKTGSLKFKPDIASIILKQFGVTYDIIKKRGANGKVNGYRIAIQGLKTKLRVHGMSQIEKFAENFANKNIDNLEFGCAKLLKINQDYYLHVTCYANKPEVKKEENSIVLSQEEKNILAFNRSIGIDFGCETQMTLSNGLKITYGFPPDKRIKRQHKELSRRQHLRKLYNKKHKKNKRLAGKNEIKSTNRLKKLYYHNNNRKKDVRNKIVHGLISNYDTVIFQDESIKAWQAGNHGKKINSTAIGGIIADLKSKSRTPVEVDKFYPSTKLCRCGCKVDIPVWQRTFSCPECGFVMDRDWKSSLSLQYEGLRMIGVPTECRDFKPVETTTSTLKLADYFNMIQGVQCKLLSTKQETHDL